MNIGGGFEHSHVVASSSRVVVYAGSSERQDDGSVYESIYACRISDGRSIRLDDREGPILEPNTVYDPIRVSGARVAFVDSELVDQFPSSQSALHLLDMRTLNERLMEVVGDDGGCWSDLELLPAGGLAWIRRATDREGEPTFDERWAVLKCDRGCRTPIRLGEGKRIAPRSLELAGGRVSWRDGGKRRSAPLR